MSGIATFQDGFPLALTATGTANGLGYGRRPNVVAGCNPKLSGSAQSRLNGWFNVSCFSVPAAYTLGNESATDPVLRGQGINNWDFVPGEEDTDYGTVQPGVPRGGLQPVQSGAVRTSEYQRDHGGEPDHGVSLLPRSISRD